MPVRGIGQIPVRGIGVLCDGVTHRPWHQRLRDSAHIFQKYSFIINPSQNKTLEGRWLA